jgi:NAD(P)-dependent dehydrogenase (short-subunit alcohol dehydrogenase family)
MDKPLEGKIAFVTGSGRGLGRAIAERLAELGASVAIHDISREAPAKYGESHNIDETAEQIARFGTRTAAGEHEVVSLWVLPPNPATLAFVSSIQRTTIEELVRNMATYIGGPAAKVRFAPNPF